MEGRKRKLAVLYFSLLVFNFTFFIVNFSLLRTFPVSPFRLSVLLSLPARFRLIVRSPPWQLTRPRSMRRTESLGHGLTRGIRNGRALQPFFGGGPRGVRTLENDAFHLTCHAWKTLVPHLPHAKILLRSPGSVIRPSSYMTMKTCFLLTHNSIPVRYSRNGIIHPAYRSRRFLAPRSQ